MSSGSGAIARLVIDAAEPSMKKAMLANMPTPSATQTAEVSDRLGLRRKSRRLYPIIRPPSPVPGRRHGDEVRLLVLALDDDGPHHADPGHVVLVLDDAGVQPGGLLDLRRALVAAGRHAHRLVDGDHAAPVLGQVPGIFLLVHRHP